VGNLELSAVGGEVKLLMVGNGFATVGVRPGSALCMRAGRKPRRCGWKRVGIIIARGVRVDINLEK
jgi:hypothetical protein